jgi:ArsR family transcriptional regulator
MEQVKELAQFYKALGDETRLFLICLLAKQIPGQARCVGSLASALNTTASNVSQHLKVLKDLGLIIPSRRGYRIHYFLNHDRIAKFDLLRAELLGDTFTKQINLDELEETTMCCKQDKDCKHPDRKPQPEDCTPEQIIECHGEDVTHHCCEKQTS